MNHSTPCPTVELSLLIRDELSIPETSRIAQHIESCATCQQRLEELAAEGSWWSDAADHLSGRLPVHDSEIDWSCSGDSVIAKLTTAPNGPRSGISRGTRADAAVLDSPRHPEMLGRIGQYDVEEKIGQGGMGIVYRGFDTGLNRSVAIKVLAPHLASSGIARKRFTREARAAAAVRHPNVVPIYNVNASDERPYIVMALVDGSSLEEYVQKHGPLEPIDVVRVARQIAAGLVAAHEQGLIHRDIKPANILIDQDVSRVMISDFGLARAADDVAMTQTGWLAGTPHYMSPEQARGRDIDHRSDLFSLGSVMYFMATGREPFRAEKPLAVLEKINSAEPLAARSVNTQIPSTLNGIIHGLLEKDAGRRIESADKVRELLNRYLAHLQHPQSNPKPKLPATNGRLNFHIKSLALALSALIMLSLAVNYALNVNYGNQPSPPATAETNSPGKNIQQSENRFSWMKDLQSYDVWIDEANQLERDLDQFEAEFTGFEFEPELDSFDPVTAEEQVPEEDR